MSITPTLGNDIVDLCDEDNQRSARRTRYAKRVLSPAEFAHWRAAPDASLWLWALWAAKEALHKASAGHGVARVFAPRQRCICRNYGDLAPRDFARPSGALERAASDVVLHWTWTVDFVHCVARANALDATSRVAAIRDLDLADDQPGRAARKLAIGVAGALVGVPAAQLQIPQRLTREERPKLMADERPRDDVHLSLSHDGRFVACALAC